MNSNHIPREQHAALTKVKTYCSTFPLKHLLTTSICTTHSSPTGTSTQLLSLGVAGAMPGSSGSTVPLCSFSFQCTDTSGSSDITVSTCTSKRAALMTRSSDMANLDQHLRPCKVILYSVLKSKLYSCIRTSMALACPFALHTHTL